MTCNDAEETDARPVIYRATVASVHTSRERGGGTTIHDLAFPPFFPFFLSFFSLTFIVSLVERNRCRERERERRYKR